MLSSITRIQGFGHMSSITLIHLNEYHRDTGHRVQLVSGRLLNLGAVEFANSIVPNNIDCTYIKYLNLIKLLMLRSYRARRLASLRPVRGQRRWHNAHTVRYANTFLHKLCIEYMAEFFTINRSRYIRYTKQLEMRAKSRLKSTKKQRRFTKFKGLGERAAVRSIKKSQWD